MITDKNILDLLRKISDQSIGLNFDPDFYGIVREWLTDNKLNNDWKEKLLDYIETIELQFDPNISRFYNNEHPTIDIEELKQKIEEL